MFLGESFPHGGMIPLPLRIIIPIPKGGKKSKNDKVDIYRGITISPIISKVLEMCLLTRLEGCSDRQFGFIRGVGCSDALYTLR